MHPASLISTRYHLKIHTNPQVALNKLGKFICNISAVIGTKWRFHGYKKNETSLHAPISAAQFGAVLFCSFFFFY